MNNLFLLFSKFKLQHSSKDSQGIIQVHANPGRYPILALRQLDCDSLFGHIELNVCWNIDRVDCVVLVTNVTYYNLRMLMRRILTLNCMIAVTSFFSNLRGYKHIIRKQICSVSLHFTYTTIKPIDSICHGKECNFFGIVIINRIVSYIAE